MNRIQQFWHSAAELLFGAAALAFLTWICFWLQLDIATTVPAYMIVVVLLSLRGRVLPAVILSVIAARCLDYFLPHRFSASRSAVRKISSRWPSL
jgi:K+-sensing histidine kinase KdpD